MIKPRLKFRESVPKWIQRIAMRWVNRITPSDWTITFIMENVAELEKNTGKGTRAYSLAYPEQLDAAVWIAEGIEQDEETERIILHEIRHAHYWCLKQVLSQAWDGRRKMTFAQADKLLDDKIEEMIERDVNVFLRAYRR